MAHEMVKHCDNDLVVDATDGVALPWQDAKAEAPIARLGSMTTKVFQDVKRCVAMGALCRCWHIFAS